MTNIDQEPNLNSAMLRNVNSTNKNILTQEVEHGKHNPTNAALIRYLNILPQNITSQLYLGMLLQHIASTLFQHVTAKLYHSMLLQHVTSTLFQHVTAKRYPSMLL